MRKEDILLGKSFIAAAVAFSLVFSLSRLALTFFFFFLFSVSSHRSRAPQDRLQLAIGLGLVNLFGAIYVGEQWSSFQPPISALLWYLSRALLFYAWAYLITPLCRLAFISRYNQLIDERNMIRMYLLDDFNKQCLNPKSAVSKKLDFAFKYRKEVCVGKGLGENDVPGGNVMSI